MRIFLLLLLLSAEVIAQSDVGPLLSVLESPAPNANACTQEDFVACRRSLCGDGRSYQRQNDADYEALYDPAAFGSVDSVRERLSAILIRQRQRNINAVNTLNTQIAAGEFKMATDDWDASKWDNEAHRLFSNHVEWDVDRNRPIGEKIILRPVNIEGKSPAFIEALRLYSLEAAAAVSTPRDLIGNYLLTETELRATIEESQRMIPESQMTPELRNRIQNETNTQSLAWSLFTMRPKTPRVFACTSAACRDKLSREIAASYLPNLRKFQQINESPDFVERYLPQCLSAYMQASVRAPESEAMMASLPAMREKYLTAISFLSQHSRDLFKTYMEQGIEYTTGLNQNPRVSLDRSFETSGRPHAQESLEAFLAERAEPLTGMDACRTADYIETDYFQPNRLSFEGNEDGVVKTIGNQDGKDTINLSEFNCTHADLGEGVFLHELGHALSHIIGKNSLSTESRQKYLDLRRCIAAAGPQVPRNERFDGDMLATEEDMADFLAARIPLAGAYPSSCQLVRDENVSTMTNDKNDHSPPMVRLIRDSRARGNMPSQCQPVYNQYASQFRAETCTP